jgi:hypothetical protein
MAKEINITEEDKKRFLSKVRKDDVTGCWHWTGKIQRSKGRVFGQFWIKPTNVYATKFSWLIHRGVPPEHHKVYNTCNSECCVNPEHLKCVRSEVRPWDYYKDKFLSKIKKCDSGCWEWQGFVQKSTGYGNICVNDYPILTHRYAYTVFVGPIPKGLHICHRCDNRQCCNPDHLFAGTVQDNMDDCVAKGRKKMFALRGEKAPNAKLKEWQVVEIKRLLVKGVWDRSRIADVFGVSPGAIHQIAIGNNWAHVNINNQQEVGR